MPEALVLREEEGPAVAWLVHGESAPIEAMLGFAVPAAHRWLEQG